jgi:hypothetical protein
MKTPEQQKQIEFAERMVELTNEGNELVAQLGKAVDNSEEYTVILKKLKENHAAMKELKDAHEHVNILNE